MKESNSLVDNAANNFLRREILLNTKGKYTKESNILVGNAANNFLRREILLNIKGHYMKESDILVGNATIKQLKGSLDRHKREVYEGVNYPCRQCGLQFSQKGSLARHHRSVHRSQ